MKETAQRLREKGLIVTPQRLAIYNMLLHTKEHPNAEIIHRALEPDNPTMSLATVYKTLDYFKQCGLVQELNVGAPSARYDAGVHCHPHTVCLSCGDVADLNMNTLANLHKTVAIPSDFEVSHEQLILYGTCTVCKKRNVV